MLQNIIRRSFCIQKKFLAQQAKLATTDAGVMNITIPRFQKIQRLQIPKNSTLADLAAQLKNNLQMTDIKFYCNLQIQLPQQTRLEPMVNRYFYVDSKQYRPLLIQGDQFDHGNDDEIIQGIDTLQLPAMHKREIQDYFRRVNRWFQFRTGHKFTQQRGRITTDLASTIFVESLIDPQPQERSILALQREWEKIYWQVQDLRNQKRAADQICLKRVKRRMSFGLVLLLANIGFIWSGTYVIYSWDIVEPLAYFVSSLGGIILAAQYFKIGRPYSNYAYQQYLIEKLSPKIYEQVGFSVQNLTILQNQLLQLESILKDHLLKRL